MSPKYAFFAQKVCFKNYIFLTVGGGRVINPCFPSLSLPQCSSMHISNRERGRVSAVAHEIVGNVVSYMGYTYSKLW